MKKAIIVGASSGIGRELAKVLASHEYDVGITARRVELLNDLAKVLPTKTYIRKMDLSDTDSAIHILDDLLSEMADVDLIILNAGTGHLNPTLDWSLEKETIETNVFGFTALAGTAINYFLKQKSGHLVGISSIASIRGTDSCPAYNASKAFMSNYLEGLWVKAQKSGMGIVVSDIQPGFVDTAMAQGEGLFWVASPTKAANQIFRAIQHKKKTAYITRRWALVAWLFKILPSFLYCKI
jgi:short-subunit dehydrogenase